MNVDWTTLFLYLLENFISWCNFIIKRSFYYYCFATALAFSSLLYRIWGCLSSLNSSFFLLKWFLIAAVALAAVFIFSRIWYTLPAVANECVIKSATSWGSRTSSSRLDVVTLFRMILQDKFLVQFLSKKLVLTHWGWICRLTEADAIAFPDHDTKILCVRHGVCDRKVSKNTFSI